MTTRYYTGNFRSGDIIIDEHTISITGSSDLDFNVAPGAKINFHLGNTTIEYGGAGATVPPTRNPKVLLVTPTGGGGDFNSVKAAVDSVSGATSTNTFAIHVAPGVYVEDTITMKPYVDILGEGLQLSTIRPTSMTGPIFIGKANSCIKSLYLHGATAGTAVSATNLMSVYPFRVEDCYFGSNLKQVVLTNTIPAPSLLQVSGCYAGGLDNFTTGFEAISTNAAGVSFMSIKGLTVADFVTPWFDTLIRGNGSGSQLVVDGMLTRITPTTGASTTCFSVENGAECRAIANTIRGYERGFHITSGGLPPRLEASGNNLECTLYNIDVGHTGALGSFTGYSEITKTRIPFGAPFFLTYLDPRIITVSKKGGDYSSIAAAVESITDASESNRYVIQVAPGEYLEPLIDISNKPYVSINGSQIQSAKITPDLTGGDHHIFKIGQYNELSFLWIQGAPVGYAGIYALDTGDYSQAHKITIVDCDIGILVKGTNTDTVFYGEYIDVNGSMDTAYKCIVDTGDTGTAFMNLENCYVFPDDSGAKGIVVSGIGASSDFMVGGLDYAGVSNTGTVGIEVIDGAVMATNSVYINNFERAVSNPNIGTACDIKISSTNFTESSAYDIFIGHPSTKLAFQGSADSTKISNASSNTSWYFVDSATGVFEITNRINMTFNNVHKTDLTTLLLEGGTMGLLEGGVLSANATGTTVLVSAGYGYIDELAGDVVKRIDWGDRSIDLPNYSSNYIYITFDNTLSFSSNAPESEHNIILGRVDTYNGNVNLIEKTPLVAHHAGNLNEHFNRDALGSIFNTGCIVSDGGSRTLDVTSGNYFFGSNEFYPTGGTGIFFHEMYRNSSITGGWFMNETPVNTVNNTHYDDGTGVLNSLGLMQYSKHSLYLSGDGAYQKYFLIFSQQQYMTLVQAEGADIALPPPYFSDSIVLIATIIMRQGDSNIIEIQDARPTLAFKAPGVSASSNHSNLLGLSNDDHTQYLLVNGNRSMAGNLNMGGFAISGATTFNGVTIQTHGSRHLPNGADPLATSVPVQVGTANATGTANFFARSDHVHSHGNQAGGSLHAISTTTVNGFMSAADKVILNNIAASQLVTLNATGAIPNARVLGTNFFINNTHVSPTAAISESKLELNFPTHSNANDPSADEKAALTGTFGAPSGSNRYVTELDPRVVTSTLIPTANVATDMANLATVATQQEGKGLPIYLHDTNPGGNVNVGTPLYYNSTTGTNPWNYLSWVGVGTTGVSRAPFVAFTGAGCVFAAPMVLGLSFTLLNAGTTVNLNGGASVTTTWQIGDIFTDNSTSQEITFGAGKYLVGRIEFLSNGVGKIVTLGDRADVKITTLSLRGGAMYCGSNSTLDVDLCSGIASTIFIGANSSLVPQANCHVLVQSPANNTFQLYGGNCTLETCNSSSVIVRSSATGARIIGNGNAITVATGATNIFIHGVNTVTDFGTNTLILNSSTGISTTNGIFSGSVTTSNLNTDSLTVNTINATGTLSANTLNTNDLNVTGATSLFTLLTSGESVFSGTGTFSNVSVTGALGVNEISVSGNASVTGDLSVGGSLNVTGATSLGATTVRTNLGVTNNATIGGNILAIGSVTSSSNTVSGNQNIGGVLNVTGATSVGGLTVRNDLGVVGNANFTGTLSCIEGFFSGKIVTESASVTGTLSVGGNTNINGTLNVTGASSVGVLNVRDTLGVVGNTSITGALSVGGTLNVTGATTTTSITNTGNVTVGGNIVMTNVTGGALLSNNVTGFRELILGQTGDQFGESRLLIRNRNAENGVIMEATNGVNIDLVDFILRNNVHQRNIRLESRGSNARAGTPSFHIGGTAPDNPTVAFGDTFFNTNTTTRMAVGGYLTDASTKLHITDSGAGTSNLRFTNTNTGVSSTDGFEIGYGSSAFINNREATGLSILTNNVERMNISSSGSLIYVGPATFNSSVNVAGATTLNGVTLNTLTATGATTLNGVTLNTLVATGATTLNSIGLNTLVATGATFLNSVGLNTLTATGAGTFSTTLGVTGLATLTGVNFTTGAASTHLAGNGTQLTLRANAANTSGTVRVIGTTPSSAFNNGALVVDGGIGSGGAIFANTSLNTGNLSIASSSITNNANGVDTQLVTLGTGRVSVSADPTADLHVSTKKYVDDIFARTTIYKTVTEQRIGNANYVPDETFGNIPLGTGIFTVRGRLFANNLSSTAPDLRVQFGVSGETTLNNFYLGFQKFGSGTTNTTFTNNRQLAALSLSNAVNAIDTLLIDGIIDVIGANTTFNFLWGQNAGGGQASQILAGSFIQFQKIG